MDNNHYEMLLNAVVYGKYPTNENQLPDADQDLLQYIRKYRAGEQPLSTRRQHELARLIKQIQAIAWKQGHRPNSPLNNPSGTN